ncbi:MAG: hypothetical protein GC202_09020 [Alphaproteobacteria bacterium]|nr:hypothetical protein [Alphaproteobacteria bacterium]
MATSSVSNSAATAALSTLGSVKGSDPDHDGDAGKAETKAAEQREAAPPPPPAASGRGKATDVLA